MKMIKMKVIKTKRVMLRVQEIEEEDEETVIKVVIQQKIAHALKQLVILDIKSWLEMVDVKNAPQELLQMEWELSVSQIIVNNSNF